MSRPRSEIIADLEAILIELDSVEQPDDQGEGWVLDDFLVLATWSQLDAGGSPRNAMAVTHRHDRMPGWKLRGMCHEAIAIYDAEQY